MFRNIRHECNKILRGRPKHTGRPRNKKTEAGILFVSCLILIQTGDYLSHQMPAVWAQEDVARTNLCVTDKDPRTCPLYIRHTRNVLDCVNVRMTNISAMVLLSGTDLAQHPKHIFLLFNN